MTPGWMMPECEHAFPELFFKIPERVFENQPENFSFPPVVEEGRRRSERRDDAGGGDCAKMATAGDTIAGASVLVAADVGRQNLS